MADNTLASPRIQRPLALGFDIVVHSSTEYLNGHSDVSGGIAVVSGDDRNAEHLEQLQFLHNAVGAIAGPFDSYLARGVKTLNVRMQRHGENAQELAAWLERQPAVRGVSYPGLASHPQYALARFSASTTARHDVQHGQPATTHRPGLPNCRRTRDAAGSQMKTARWAMSMQRAAADSSAANPSAGTRFRF